MCNVQMCKSTMCKASCGDRRTSDIQSFLAALIADGIMTSLQSFLTSSSLAWISLQFFFFLSSIRFVYSVAKTFCQKKWLSPSTPQPACLSPELFDTGSVVLKRSRWEIMITLDCHPPLCSPPDPTSLLSPPSSAVVCRGLARCGAQLLRL